MMLPCDFSHLGELLPHLRGVIIGRLECVAGSVQVAARARTGEATCRACGTASSRVHSRYLRRLRRSTGDNPVGSL